MRRSSSEERSDEARCNISKSRCRMRLSRRPLGSAVEHSLHTRGVSSSNLLAGTKIQLTDESTGDIESPVSACRGSADSFSGTARSAVGIEQPQTGSRKLLPGAANSYLGLRSSHFRPTRSPGGTPPTSHMTACTSHRTASTSHRIALARNRTSPIPGFPREFRTPINRFRSSNPPKHTAVVN